MTRMSKQGERRNKFPRKRQRAPVKTGSRKDNLPNGYREHANAVDGQAAALVFVPKVR